ncbi:hypothetical protein D3C78_1257140 [compost metagenome]
MEQPDDEHVDEHPGGIENGDEPIGRKHGAQRRHIADALGPGSVGQARSALHDGVHHGRRKPLVHQHAHHVLQARAQVVQDEQDQQCHAGAGQQHQQRFVAIGRDDPVEHLQGEERGHQEQQIDEERERCDIGQQRTQFCPQ